MIILGIETSCDETAVAVLKVSETEITVLSNLVNSQISIHKQFGGIVPEVAARQHIKNNLPLVSVALEKAQTTLDQIDLLAVTQGPGLAGSLMVGLEIAKTTSMIKNIPLVPVNHLEGHLWSYLLPKPFANKSYDLQFPFVALIVSGGHTELVLVKNVNQYQVLGKTLDDAVGEAFDKVAKILDLGYPGGPAISKIGKLGNRNKYKFPRPLLQEDNYDFSFSGLKTSVLYQVKKISQVTDQVKADVAASFEAAAVDTLIGKLNKAISKHQVEHVVVVGGVSANQYLREQLADQVPEKILLHLPDMVYTGDNAAMIALAGFFSKSKLNPNSKEMLSLSVLPNLSISKNDSF